MEVLLLAREMGVLRLGTIGLDGTKVHANASGDSALSYQRAGEIEAQLKGEVADLLARAEAADAADLPDRLSIPEEPALRQKRLAQLSDARARIEARSKARFEREKAEHGQKIAARAAKTQATGKKPGGHPPAPPVEGARPGDQINLTDEESRIMPVAGGGFEQCYNAQAAVAAGSFLVVATDVVQAPNDTNQVEPVLGKITALPAELDAAEVLLADTGYFSAYNVEACLKAGMEPIIALGKPRGLSRGRQPHHPPLAERIAPELSAPGDPGQPAPGPVEKVAWRMKTREGRALYALRKQTPEPVFGIIKSVRGFRQFSMRGLE